MAHTATFGHSLKKEEKKNTCAQHGQREPTRDRRGTTGNESHTPK